MCKKLDIQHIIDEGKVISSEEALSDVVPVEWSEEVLQGKYKDVSIVK